MKELHPAPSIERDDVHASTPRTVALYHSGPSICSQKVRLTLAAKGVQWEDREINMFIDENLEPSYMRINPRGVVPTLIDGECTVFDSGAIMRYIDRNLPGPQLEPEDDGLKSVMNQWLEAQDQFPIRGLTYGNAKGLMGKLARSKQPARIDKLKQLRDDNPDLKEDYEAKLRDTEQWIEEQSDKVIIGKITAHMETLLDGLEQQLKGNQWIVGDQYTLADIAWTTILARIDFVGLDKRMWGDGRRPGVKAYLERLKGVRGFDDQVTHYQNKPYMLKRLLQSTAHRVLKKMSIGAK
ncbi:MAG: glutathione S-transferase family protein [bacterium]|nr:glutathione S-transferase family protein [bacterium]